MSSTVEDLFGQIEKNHMMPAKDVEAVKARWFRAGRKDADDPAKFCEWLKVNGFLSDFLLVALTRGKADQLTLNQYRLTDLLQSGPEAGDFLATDPLDRILRVQIVSPTLAKSAGWLDKFRRAVQRVMKVQHAGVGSIYDLGEAEGIEYLVSEYVEGESLEHFLKKRDKLSYDFAARIFALVFDGVAALYQQGLPCGELTPRNLVLAGAGKGGAGGVRTIRLVNVAFPHQYFNSAALGIVNKDQLPESALRPPTVDDGYQMDGPPRPEADNFRLGSIFYRCITGKDPYSGSQAQHPSRGAPPLRQVAPEVPSMLADLIDSMIDPLPANRPKSATAVAKSLRIFLKTEEEEKQSRIEDKIVAPAPSAPPPATDAAGTDQVTESTTEKIPLDGLEVPAGEPEIGKLFRAVMKHEGSDLHLAIGLPPMMRLRNVIRQMDLPPLTAEEMEKLVMPILSDRTRGILEQTGGADFAYIVGKGECRFRVNLFRQRGQFGLVARRVNTSVPTFAKLGLPPAVEKLCHFDQGMVIVAGVTGSGKSTTLAAMLDYINEREQLHILTIEDPIEFLFTSKKAVINQREVGIDVFDWTIALKHAVRQDPDVILVGEMRDRETFEAGLNAAETGHLVFCTLHASSAASTISRILDLFPADTHQAVRQSLAFNLKGIICQKLVPSIKAGVQRVPTNEILIMNPTIRELIIKGEDKKLPDAIRIGMIEGMLDFNESLRQLVERGDVSQEAALEVSPNPDSLKMAFKGIRLSQPGIL
jgi:twitching motility protein PilT